MGQTSFKGKIYLSRPSYSTRKVLFSYEAETLEASFDQSMMASFDTLNLTVKEKQKLSLQHRNKLSRFKNINLFVLNRDSKKLIEQINNYPDNKLVIEANDYGAYVCLAALYSGKLSNQKSIEFVLEKSPIALFPNNFIKCQPHNTDHKVSFKVSADSWLAPFSSLYQHDKIKCILKAA